jgi:catechol 2,3-dioxygenase-like lactoylglutathione lyase family enzyme
MAGEVERVDAEDAPISTMETKKPAQAAGNRHGEIGRLLVELAKERRFPLIQFVANEVDTLRAYPGCDPEEGNHIARFVLLVDDLDRETEFFTKVLDFELLAIREFSGPDMAALYAVPNLQLRVGILQLGNQKISLAEYVGSPGECYPEETRGHDVWFQHLAIVVSDMEAAHARLVAAGVKATSPYPITIPESNPAAAGVKAFYFRDPENHPLELISFPPYKGLPAWQEKSGKLFLGIDHSAITVADTAKSLHFYRDLLGLEKKGESLNFGESQELLSGVKNARVHITGLRYNHPTAAGIEFLHYLMPEDGKPIPAGRSTTDRAYAHSAIFSDDLPALVEKLKYAGVSFVSPGIVRLQQKNGAFGSGCLVRDPDGHDVLLVGN